MPDYQDNPRERVVQATLEDSFVRDLIEARRTAQSVSSIVDQPRKYVIEKFDPSETELRVATISLPIDPSSCIAEDIEINKQHYKLWHMSEENQQNMTRIVFEEMEKVRLKKGARLYCINELGFPTFPVIDEASGSIKMNDEKLQETKNKYQDYANRNECYLLAGSFHCFHSWCNMGLFFFPQQGRGRQSPIEIQKNTTAFKVKEYIRRANPPRFMKIEWKFGTITPLICTDILSPELFLSIVQDANRLVDSYSVPHLVINPSFARDFSGVPIQQAVRRLAVAAGIVTIFVNHCVGRGAIFPIPDALIYGGSNRWNTGEKISEYTKYYSLDLEEVRSWSEIMRLNLSDKLKYVWGIERGFSGRDI